MPMSAEAQAVLDRELVLVRGTLYPHEQFIAALQQATLDRVSVGLPQGATVRQAFKVVSAMRTEAGHRATLRVALDSLVSGGDSVSREDVSDKHYVVACFPGT